ncbi:TonB-dependent receptor [Sphingobacterium sp. SRCM116780]|uniref:TonB-dependent receptor n=1 Tax=Sphingobacterium sp. SRCM116780 TaxID=2907623 RepID=UPI001F22563B|nr:TonB-dependent receptor [Sphingobacterium sp. SRCM116780]UIR57442.1 TonB-dependent receptor [Sphingobacterium sp. SRCM116780]
MKSTSTFYALSLIGILFFCHSTAWAQQFEVVIKDPQNKPLSQVNITLNGKKAGYSDQQGRFVTEKGSWNNPIQIRVSYTGFTPVEKTINLDTVQSPIYFQLNTTRVLDEIVVTAGRKPESISTVPSSISILNSKEIEAQSQISTNLSTILGNTIPGLGTSTNKATNSGQTLRGRAVLVLIDGIPQSTPLMNGQRDLRTIDPSVIERIEVIKGATSIYGNGSAGGIINYITRTPSVTSSVLQGLTTLRTTFNPVHPDGTMGYRASQTFFGRKEKWNYTLSGSADYTGLQRDADGVPLGQTDGLSNTYQYNAFFKLGYTIDSSSSLTAVYNFYRSNQHNRYISQTGVYGKNPTIGIRGEEPGKPAGTPYNHNAMLTYIKSNLIGQTSLTASAYYNTFRSMNRYVQNASAWYGPGQTQINSEKKGLRINLNTPFTFFHSPADITYGLDLLNDVTDQNLTDGRVYIPYMDMLNFAPYAQIKIDFFENLIFKGGVRYENATVKIKDFNTIATGPNNEGSIAVKGGKIPYKGATFNAGLRYNKYAVFNPFISFSQGFAINELGRIVRRATNNDLDSILTDPIVTNNYEIGFSSNYSIFQLSASYYYSTSKMGVELVDVGGYLTAQRLPEDVYGYEIALNANLNRQFTVGGTLAYVEGKSKKEDGTKTYLNGSRIAPLKATAYLYFTPIKPLSFQFFWVHTGSRDRFLPNDKGVYKNSEGTIKSIDLFNMNGNYQVNQQWSLGLGIENLFNKNYFPVVSQYRALNEEYVKGQGMLASFNINYKF